MRASFKMHTKSLKQLISITTKQIYFKILNNEIRFVEMEAGRQIMGILKNISDLNISTEIQNSPTLSLNRIFSVDVKQLDYFSSRVIGDKVEIEIKEDKIFVYDHSNKIRMAKIRLLEITTVFKDDKFTNMFNKRVDFVVKDGVIHNQFLINVGSYIIIKNDDRNYKNSNIPSDEIKWTLDIKKDKVDLVERRLTEMGNYSDDVWHYDIEAENFREGVDRPSSLKIYYRAANVNKYVNKSGTNQMIIAITKEHNMVVFLIKNTDYISVASALRPKIAELFEDE